MTSPELQVQACRGQCSRDVPLAALRSCAVVHGQPVCEYSLVASAQRYSGCKGWEWECKSFGSTVEVAKTFEVCVALCPLGQPHGAMRFLHFGASNLRLSEPVSQDLKQFGLQIGSCTLLFTCGQQQFIFNTPPFPQQGQKQVMTSTFMMLRTIGPPHYLYQRGGCRDPIAIYDFVSGSLLCACACLLGTQHAVITILL